MKHYNKLVRDKIPEIIASYGKNYESKVIGGDKLLASLKLKLEEELAEFGEAHDPEELADILEVVHGLAACIGISINELEKIRLAKVESNGGFEKGIFLVAADP
tara:strand:- start:245 stop:556 length:312 start_codon:yes stop_codon:yes gene_type:complete